MPQVFLYVNDDDRLEGVDSKQFSQYGSSLSQKILW